MSRAVSNLVGAFVEAWAELRIHRTRVLLSLIGVAVAVAALTSVVGVGAIAQQATTESFERSSGRPATLSVYAYDPVATTQADPLALSDAFSKVMDRYSIDWSSRNSYTPIPVQLSDGVRPIDSMLVDPDYGEMHRIQLIDGAWFADSDATRLAPAVIVNEAFWNQLGRPDVRTHPTLDLPGDTDTTAVVTGVVADQYPDAAPMMTMLVDSYLQIATPTQRSQVSLNFEIWVPTEISDELSERIRRDMVGELGRSWTVEVSRQDYLAFGGEDPLLPVRLIVGGVSILILFLGALSLVNISLVTIRQRIREIGIRRSFGATAGRVFFAVMMESVVGTIAAGVVGVFIAVLVVRSEAVQNIVAPGVSNVPAFPLEAALLGMAAATAVGALAGLLPALVAVRVKVIDAIRY